MAYSTKANSRWYTYWYGGAVEASCKEEEIFAIRDIGYFRLDEIKGNMDRCIQEAVERENKINGQNGEVTASQRTELRTYMLMFIAEVEKEYKS